MSHFQTATQEVLSDMAEALSTEEAPERVVDYIRDDARLREAQAVAELADTFACYEVNPTEKPGIGRYAGRTAMSPAIGNLLAKGVRRLDSDGRRRLEKIVCTSVACQPLSLLLRGLLVKKRRRSPFRLASGSSQALGFRPRRANRRRRLNPAQARTAETSGPNSTVSIFPSRKV